MSTFRKDPISGGWVIFADDYQRHLIEDMEAERSTPSVGASEPCPFCEGREAFSAHELYAVRDNGSLPGTPGWRLRVVPNKFPLLRIEGDIGRSADGIYDLMNGLGAHEIVIETPRHDACLGHYGQAKVESVVRAWLERSIDLYRDQRFRYVQVFRAQGRVAGARQTHPHSQIVAMPVMPRWIAEQLISAREHYDYKERCLFCDILGQELKDRSRIVYENAGFVTLAPFASRVPFELQILPRAHNPRFTNLAEGELPAFAEALRRTLHALHETLNHPAYVLSIDSAPRVARPAGIERIYHWRATISPRLGRIGGFEWSTGFFINPTPPEQAAAALRRVLATQPEPASALLVD